MDSGALLALSAVLAASAGPGVVGAESLRVGVVQGSRCAARCLSLRLLQGHFLCSLFQTMDQRVRLPDVRPGRWYQFRVAAVNVNGTWGFTTPGRHFWSSRAPSAPPAPADLRVPNSTVHGADGTVAATVAWEPPEDPNVPVHHYRVSWGHVAEGQQQRKTADGRRSSVTLQCLRPGGIYTMQLQAVSQWGPMRLRSPKAALHFTTAGGPQLQRKALTLSQHHSNFPGAFAVSTVNHGHQHFERTSQKPFGKGSCQPWVAMETPHGFTRSLYSWGSCQSYVTMKMQRGLPRSLCRECSCQSCVICMPNRFPRSLCSRGSYQLVHSPRFTQA